MKDFNHYYERFPKELRDSLDQCIQDPVYHKEGSVSNHLRLIWRVIDEKHSGDPFLKAVCLFHDLGKPATRAERIDREGRQRVSHIGHENLCDGFIDQYGDLFRDLTQLTDRLKTVCRLHMRAHQYRDNVLKKPSKREAFEKLPEFKWLMAFAECDAEGK